MLALAPAAVTVTVAEEVLVRVMLLLVVAQL